MLNHIEASLSQGEALGFEFLGREQGIPAAGEWHLEGIASSLREVFGELYQNRRVNFFNHTQPLTEGSPYNLNQIEAAFQLTSWVAQGERGLFHVDSCMGAGTSSLLAFLTDVFKGQSVALQHIKGAEQYGKNEIVTHALAGGHSTGIQTKTFIDKKGLFDLLKEVDEKKKLVVVDETQFTEGGEDVGFWEAVRDWAKQTKKSVVVGQLNLMYTGEPWDVTKAIVKAADGGVVVAARGAGSDMPAWMTKREVRLGDGRIRPDSLEAEKKIVGDVHDKQQDHIYNPVYWKDFDVCTEREAELFDTSSLQVFER